MRISDWSSDVCSSDLSVGAAAALTMAELKTLLALVKGDVGLGNVDNTCDADKPVSSAQQTALDLKINKSIMTAADDVLVGSGDSTPAVVNIPASLIFCKKEAGGSSRPETRRVGKE